MSASLPPPAPLAAPGQPVDWLFIYKFNSASFPGCTDAGTAPPAGTKGIFGGVFNAYLTKTGKAEGHSQRYVYATSANPTLTQGTGCVGATPNDPLGATFGQVYNQPGYFYVVWNDQFYANPIASQGGPWGHAKGMVAWNAAGQGFVLQVSTPSWPGSASSATPRQNDGNTLGCIQDDDIQVAQHFFAVKLTPADLATVLQALANASVLTDRTQPSIFKNGGPPNIQQLANQLGQQSTSTAFTAATLSTGVQILSKPSAISAPPWQMISAKLGGLPLRVASWWAEPAIYSTTADTPIKCWAPGLGKPGPVEIATSGIWNKVKFSFTGGMGMDHNHAKVGVSTDPKQPLCLFGDMNQQGALDPGYAYVGQACDSSQNGRGGTFYALNNPKLFASLTQLLQGSTASTIPPPPAPYPPGEEHKPGPHSKTVASAKPG